MGGFWYNWVRVETMVFRNYFMNKAIIFDADGVLINAEMFSVAYQKKFGVSNDEMLPFFKGVFQECLVGKADLKVEVEPFLAKWKWPGSVDELLQFWFQAEHQIDERMVAWIKESRVRGVKCYLATNQEKYRTEYMKQEMAFAEIFDHIFSSAELDCKKPQAEFFQIILKWLEDNDKIKINEIFYTDDSQEAINAAKTLGIGSFLYKDFESFLSAVNPGFG